MTLQSITKQVILYHTRPTDGVTPTVVHKKHCVLGKYLKNNKKCCLASIGRADEICHVRRAVTEICNITYFISAKNYLINLMITYFVAPDPVSPAEPGRDRPPLRGSRLRKKHKRLKNDLDN